MLVGRGQLDGNTGGQLVFLQPGDVIVIPAGVSHMNVTMTEDYRFVGVYPNVSLKPPVVRPTSSSLGLPGLSSVDKPVLRQARDHGRAPRRDIARPSSGCRSGRGRDGHTDPALDGSSWQEDGRVARRYFGILEIHLDEDRATGLAGQPIVRRR